eukprot:s257_g10.t1
MVLTWQAWFQSFQTQRTQQAVFVPTWHKRDVSISRVLWALERQNVEDVVSLQDVVIAVSMNAGLGNAPMDFGDGFLPDGRIYVSYEGVEFVRWKEWPAAGSEAAKLLAISPYRRIHSAGRDEDESWESDEEDIPGALAATTAAAAEAKSSVAEDNMTLDSELVDGIDSLGRKREADMEEEEEEASAGYVHTMLLRSDGSAVACGDNLFGQCDIPPLHEGMSYIQVCAGGSHTVLLRSDGNAVACGLNNCGQCNIPQLDEGVTYTQVSAGADHTVLLRSDGSAVACGLNLYGRCNIPRLDRGMAYTQVSAGGLHTVLLRSDGAAVAFGENLCGQCDVPCLDEGTTYIQVCAGNLHTVLLRNDGRAVAFGEDCDRQCNLPSLEERVKYIQVFAGNEHTVLLRSDGNAVACGRNDYGQCTIPPLEPGMCYLGRHKPIGPDLVLQVNFVCADDAVTLICSTLAGEEKLTLTAHGHDPVWDLHKRIARELNVDLQSLRVVMFDGQLLAKICQANPVAKVADLNSQLSASHLPNRPPFERDQQVQTLQTRPSQVEISEKVLAILNEVAEEDEKLSLDTALTDGIDSLGSTLVINNVQAAFGEMETAGDLTKFVTGLVEEQAPTQTPVASKKKSKPKRGSQARREKQAVETKPSQSSASVSGVRVHRQGIGPRVFLVDAHPPEAEELAGLEKVQERRAELAAALAPCTVCSLIFDEEACKCTNLAELVNAHRMIYPDAVEGEPLALAAWSFSRVIASALASSLEKLGVQDVRLILFKDGLLLPAPSEEEGDEWWGGATEAVLFTASACGAAKWAKEERRRLRKKGALRQLREDEDEVEDMQMRLFWEEGAKPGHLQQLGPKRFAELANTTGRKVEVLRSLTKGAKGVLDFKANVMLFNIECSSSIFRQVHQHQRLQHRLLHKVCLDANL